MANIDKTEESVKTEFQRIVTDLDMWGTYVDSILNKFVHSKFDSIEHIQFEASHRVKNVSSYCEKVLYRQKGGDNPLLNIQDKVGTRLVLLTSEDVSVVSEFIQKETSKWVIVEKARDVENEILQHPEVFTYQSDHFIVKPTDEYKTSVDRDYLTCEIQIRTILQHAYAEISHDTVYKKHVSSSPLVKRRLASSMAMIEAADEKFIQIYQEVNAMDDIYSKMRKILIETYRVYVPKFLDDDYNVNLAQPVFDMFKESELDFFCENLHSFCSTYDENLKFAFQETNNDAPIIFSQPISLLALFAVINFQQTLISQWPFNYESMKKMLDVMNVSDDVIG